VYLIAGPNGAGKTTFATEFLPDFVMYAPVVDSWNLYDGSQLPPSLIASRSGAAVQAHQPERYQMIQTHSGN